MRIMTNIFVLAMITTYILLAVQAEPITAIFGYIFAGMLTLALIRQTIAQGREDDDPR